MPLISGICASGSGIVLTGRMSFGVINDGGNNYYAIAEGVAAVAQGTLGMTIGKTIVSVACAPRP
jgi:hypothetical protein